MQSTISIRTILCLLFSAFFFLPATSTLTNAADSKTTKGIVDFQLEDVRFADKWQANLRSTFTSLVLDIRLINRLEQTVWFDAETSEEDLFPYLDSKSVPSNISIQQSDTGEKWRNSGEQRFGSARRQRIESGESILISIRHEVDLGDPKVARPPFRMIRVGMPLASQEEGKPATYWSPPIDVSPSRILDLLEIASEEPAVRMTQTRERIVDRLVMLRTNEDSDLQVEFAGDIPTLQLSEEDYRQLMAARWKLALEFADRKIQNLHQPDAAVVRIKTPTVTDALPSKSISAYRLDAEQLGYLTKVLQSFPEITRLGFSMLETETKVPAPFVDAIQKLPTLNSLSFGCPDEFEWSHESLKKIGSLRGLTHLSLGGIIQEEHFGRLQELSNLQSISLGSKYTPACFRMLVKLPKLNTIRITGTPSFAEQPISDETANTIQQFNGQPLKVLMFQGDYHASFVRSILQIESLTEFLLIGNVVDGTAEDFTNVSSLRHLKKLDIRLSDDSLHQEVQKLISQQRRKLVAEERRAARRKSIHGNRRNTHVEVDESITLVDAERLVENWIETMLTEGRKFDSRDIRRCGDAGLEAMLRRLFPEVTESKTEMIEVPPVKFTEADVLQLIDQLGDTKFAARNAAHRKLQEHGRPHSDLIQAASKKTGATADVEIQSRCQEILAAWEPPKPKEVDDVFDREFEQAWSRYLAQLTDYSSDELIADSIVRALEARVDQTNRANLLRACFGPIVQCKDDAIYEKFIPLCEHEDLAVPTFALKSIGGRPGNDYVTPLTKVAIESDRPELVKAAFRNSPSPVWDRSYKAHLREKFIKIFTAKPADRPFRDDPSFLVSMAFSAARDHNIPAAREFLLDNCLSADPIIATRALRGLGDTAYLRHPIDEALLRVCRKTMKSNNAWIRSSAVRLLGTYAATSESIELLIGALSDKEEEVWQVATNGLYQQLKWNQQNSGALTITDDVRKLPSTENNAVLKKRYQLVEQVLLGKVRPEWIEFID